MKIKSIFLIEKEKPNNKKITALLVIEKLYNILLPFIAGFYFHKYKSLLFLALFFIVILMPIKVDIKREKLKIIILW